MFMASFCLNYNTDDVRKHLDKLSSVVKPYMCLIDAYLSEYFTKELWLLVNTKWWQVLVKENPENLATLLNPAIFKTSNVWPLSLLALRKASHILALDRKPRKCASHEMKNILSTLGTNRRRLDNCSGRLVADIKDGQCLSLEHCYRRHVKPKKQHEIVTLGEIIHTACEAVGVKHVIDVGAGQGHLSRLLSFGYHLQVTTVEADGCHIPKAEKFDNEVKKDISLGRTVSKKKKRRYPKILMKRDSHSEESATRSFARKPVHAVAWISANVNSNKFINIIKQSQERISDNPGNSDHCDCNSEVCGDTGLVTSKHDNNDDSALMTSEGTCERTEGDESTLRDFLLTGLHACGDLTPAMMRVFLECPQAQCLASVSCCYMKLTTSCNQKGCSDLGYPLSDYCRTISCPLSYEAREMACHSIDAYHQRLLENPPSLKAHVYRAALQEIIISKSPNKIHDSVKLTFRKSHQLPFSEYAKKALGRLGLDDTITEEQLEKAERRLHQWKELVAFYTLRLSLAPLVESLLLLDRLLFLLQNGAKGALIPIFDPSLSPRNFALLAAKSDKVK